MTNNLRDFIYNEYEEPEYIIELLEKIGLEKGLSLAMEKFNNAISGNNPNNIVQLSGVVLTSVNSSLPSLPPEDKKKIEYFLGDIFDQYLNLIEGMQGSNEIFEQLYASLSEACEINSYDKNELFKIINIERYIVLNKKRPKAKYYYEWNGKPHNLDEITKDIKDKGWILSVKDFKRLFCCNSNKDDYSIKCNKEYINHLFILFLVFKEKNLIQPKGTTGHFTPFFNLAVDNQDKILLDRPANKHHDLIKRKEPEYQELYLKVEDLVLKNLSSAT